MVGRGARLPATGGRKRCVAWEIMGEGSCGKAGGQEICVWETARAVGFMEGLVHAGRALQRPAQSDVGGCGGKDAT